MLSILPHNKIVQWLCCNNNTTLTDMLLLLAQLQYSDKCKCQIYLMWFQCPSIDAIPPQHSVVNEHPDFPHVVQSSGFTEYILSVTSLQCLYESDTVCNYIYLYTCIIIINYYNKSNSILSRLRWDRCYNLSWLYYVHCTVYVLYTNTVAVTALLVDTPLFI